MGTHIHVTEFHQSTDACSPMLMALRRRRTPGRRLPDAEVVVLSSKAPSAWGSLVRFPGEQSVQIVEGPVAEDTAAAQALIHR